MKSTTHERLALCRRVAWALPSNVRAVVDTIERVTEVRIRLMRYLVIKGGWPVAEARTFVGGNGNVWR